MVQGSWLLLQHKMWVSPTRASTHIQRYYRTRITCVCVCVCECECVCVLSVCVCVCVQKQCTLTTRHASLSLSLSLSLSVCLRERERGRSKHEAAPPSISSTYSYLQVLLELTPSCTITATSKCISADYSNEDLHRKPLNPKP